MQKLPRYHAISITGPEISTLPTKHKCILFEFEQIKYEIISLYQIQKYFYLMLGKNEVKYDIVLRSQVQWFQDYLT